MAIASRSGEKEISCVVGERCVTQMFMLSAGLIILTVGGGEHTLE